LQTTKVNYFEGVKEGDRIELDEWVMNILEERLIQMDKPQRQEIETNEYILCLKDEKDHKKGR
jgi:hypothetical protein